MGAFSPFLQALTRARRPADAFAPPSGFEGSVTPDRVEDDRTGERQSGSPSSDQGATVRPSGALTGGRYDTAQMHPFDPARYPLEQQISSDKNEYNRLVAPPPPMTISQRIRNVLSSVAEAGRFTGPAAEQYASSQATLRDRAAARKQQEQENLGSRIDANQRALAQQGLGEERVEAQRQSLSDRLALMNQMNQERITGAMERTQAQQAGATGRTELQQAGQTQRATAGLQEKVREFNSTDQYRRWKEQLDADTRTRIAQMRVAASQNKAPAAMMQTAEFASGGLNRLSSADAAMQRLEQSGVFGQSWAQNKVEDWIFGKGAVDPNLTPQQRQDIGQLRAALGYTSSAAMRAHTGRTSREIYDDFKTRLGAGQDWSALRGAMNETHDMLYQYATSASDASIAAIRAGTNVPPANAPNAPTSSSGGGQRITLDQFLKER